jgi:hypothetical protein
MGMNGNVIVVDILGNMGSADNVNFKEIDLENVTKAIFDLLSHYDIYLGKAKLLKESWQKKFTWERAVNEFLIAIR